jgi:arsenite methyltransferase
MATPHWLRLQLSGPSGILARPMARILNRVNGDSYRRALEALDAQPGEQVLELGFGGGLGVDALLSDGVRVIAAEPSESMRARAYRRWSWQLAKGELEVWRHGAEELPNESVDRALSLNTVYFWRDIDLGFANLARMVKSRVVLGIAPPPYLEQAGFAKEGFRLKPIDWYQERLGAAGFACSVQAAPNQSSCALLIGDAKV